MISSNSLAFDPNQFQRGILLLLALRVSVMVRSASWATPLFQSAREFKRRIAMASGKFLLTMTGTKQGKIKGSSTKRDGGIDYSQGVECSGFNYGATVPFDSQSGAFTGRRRHQPITITRETDSASPKLLQALVSNEVFDIVKLQFFKTSSGGNSVLVRTIELRNGCIVDIRQAPSSTGKRCEHVTLAYEELLFNGIPHAVIPHFS